MHCDRALEESLAATLELIGADEAKRQINIALCLAHRVALKRVVGNFLALASLASRLVGISCTVSAALLTDYTQLVLGSLTG